MQTIPEYLMRLQAKIYASKEQVTVDKNGQYVISLDVFVLSPSDLDRLIRESRADGADDVRRWNVAFARNTAMY